ncbi:MAG: GIY-YIG nuclease family protein [Proteobacteria bacterium]|jgi:putative endonuclease|nr:GIY-YIG nuclease family protein [Pseudomonadota bacterium]
MKQPWFVYIIETENHHLYTGITKDVEKRFLAHQNGKGAKFFRIHRPKKVVYIAEFEAKEPALQREIQIKKLSANEKRDLIQSSLSPVRI